MSESLLATTSTEGLAPLGDSRLRSYELVSGTIRDRLSERHAALFGEPVATQYGDQFDWYAAVDGKARALGDLSQEDAAAVREELARLVADIASEANRLSQSKSADDQRLGEALANAVRYPGDESVYAIGHGPEMQPVLVNWAWVRENRKAVAEGLITTRSAPKSPGRSGVPAAKGPESAAASLPAAGYEGTAASGGFDLWWLLWLGWFLLAMMIAAIFYLMVEACALNLPGQPGNCPGPGASVSDIERQTYVLRDQIAAVERQIGIADRACQPERSAAIIAPKPDPDAARLAERGGREGPVTISLFWDSLADLHLEVGCPSGESIHFGRRKACGGNLDVGGNHQLSTSVRNAVESIYFNEMRSGSYEISISHYNPQGEAEVQPFRLRIKNGDVVEMFQGSVAHGQKNWTMTYMFGAE